MKVSPRIDCIFNSPIVTLVTFLAPRGECLSGGGWVVQFICYYEWEFEEYKSRDLKTLFGMHFLCF